MSIRLPRLVAVAAATTLLAVGLPSASLGGNGLAVQAGPAAAAAPTGKGRIVTIPLTGPDGTRTPMAVAGLDVASGRASDKAAGLDRAAEVAGAALRTEPLASSEFVVAGLTWDTAEAMPAYATIQLRVQERGGWSEWLAVEVDDGGPEGSDSGGTDPFITGGATAVQVRVDGDPEGLPGGLDLTLIPAGGTGEEERVTDPEVAAVLPEDEVPARVIESPYPAEEAPSPAIESQSLVDSENSIPAVGGGVGTTSRGFVSGAMPVPDAVPVDGVGNIVTRAEWGADEAYTTANWTTRYEPLQGAVVHHTAGTNTYMAAQSAGIVKAIFNYHAVTRDWGDIGYNFLVDKYGQVFEGRQNSIQSQIGAPTGWLVEAGHARGYNRGSLGISAMGDFTLATAPDASPILSAMAKVIAWKFREANLDAGALSGFFAPTTRTYTTYAAGQELPRIFGHGDVASTSCPGGLYARLGDLRTMVRNGYTRAADITPPVVGARQTTEGMVEVTGSDNMDPAPQIFYTTDGLGIRWSRYDRPTCPSRDLTLVSVDAAGNSSTPAPRAFGRFSDVPLLQPFCREITWLASEEISTGWDVGGGIGEYRPLNHITRDAMAAFMYRLAGSPSFTPPADSPFVDVPLSQPFYKEITWLASRGISTGWDVQGGAEYRPGDAINRDAMAAFMYRYQEVLVGTAAMSSSFSASKFLDVTPERPFYKEITWLASMGVSTGWSVAGVKEYRPLDQITRDAMAAFMYRLAHLV